MQQNVNEATENKLPFILSGKFFDVLSENGVNGKLVAKCVDCGQNFSGQRNATTNFKTHLKRMHPNIAAEYEREKESHKRARNQAQSTSALKQPTLTSLSMSWNGRPARPLITQTALDANICHYITEELLPLSTVEAPSFMKLVSPMLRDAPNEITLISRRTLGRRIAEGFTAMFTDLEGTFRRCKWKCLTTDIWSVNNKSYLGVTVHWINDDYTRSSAALACRRMIGSRDYTAIAKALCSIMRECGIKVSDVTAIVTDNASNFAKAFKEYAKQEPHDSDDGDESIDGDGENIAFTNIDLQYVAETVDSDIDDDLENFYLPQQERCAAHLLNLVGSKDATAPAFLEKQYNSLYNTAFGKAQAIWNKYNKSSKAADAVKEVCGKAIKVPGETRWNSKWDAINVLLDINAEKKLNEVCRSMELPLFKQSEIDFLSEWSRINRPLTTTLDSLQGDKESYYGMLLPKLSILVFELTQLSETVNVVMKSLVTAILTGVRNRFPMLELQRPESQRAILAAISNPIYKLRWVPVNQRQDVQHIFLEGLRRMKNMNMRSPGNTNTGPSDTATSDSSPEVEDEFHMFQTTADTNSNSAIDVECSNYLADGSRQLSMLQSYPTVQQLFFETNTVLPSSAAVERLFSAGGLICVPRRNKLSDAMFEKLLLLKANKYTFQ